MLIENGWKVAYVALENGNLQYLAEQVFVTEQLLVTHWSDVFGLHVVCYGTRKTQLIVQIALLGLTVLHLYLFKKELEKRGNGKR